MAFSGVSFVVTGFLDLFNKLDFLKTVSILELIDPKGYLFVVWALLSLLLTYTIGWGLKIMPSQLLKSKWYNAITTDQCIQITLSSRKFYIGYIITVNSEDMLHNAEYISLWVVMSGYRDPDNLTMIITNNYFEQFRAIFKDKNNKNYSLIQALQIMRKQDGNISSDKDFEINRTRQELQKYTMLIPVANIVTIANFDPKAYSVINNNNV